MSLRSARYIKQASGKSELNNRTLSQKSKQEKKKERKEKKKEHVRVPGSRVLNCMLTGELITNLLPFYRYEEVHS